MLIFLIHRAGEELRTQLILAIPVAYALHFCVVLAMLPGLFATEGLDWLNSPPGVYQVRLWGMILTAAFAIAVVFTAQPGALRKIWPPVLLVLLSTALCYTGTRGALPALVAGFVVTALVMTRARGSLAVTLVLGLAIGAVLSLALPVPHPAYGLISSYSETVTSQDVNQLSASRVALWTQTLEIWSKHPVFGIGYGQYRYFNHGQFEGFSHPHNSVLEFVLVFGLVGGLAFLGILFWLWLRAAQALRAHPDPVRVAAFFALNALLAFSLLDGTLYQLDTLQIYAVLWACLLARPTGVGGQSQPATL
ncbi:MAG: O-antigen ligase family protein [Pseudomonadota bacterium]